MRFYIFVALTTLTFFLALVLLGLGLHYPQARLFRTTRALAAPAASALTTLTATPQPQIQPSPHPTDAPLPTTTPTATSTALPTATAIPTSTPAPSVLAAKSVAFTPGDRAVRANIRLALNMYQGALTNVVLAPGEVFSFNAALGARPQRLPWKYVIIKPTPTDNATPEPATRPQSIQGGGLCDLASRYVMAARPLLPAKAFRFVNHLRSNGVRLAGVPARDSVSIWAVGGGPGEQDLKITNTTGGWLQFVVERTGEKITVSALLWDQPPP